MSESDNRQSEKEIYTFEELLDQKGYLVYTNTGTSMLPLLRERRDLIEIRKKQGRCKKYDVVLYKRGGRYILHRIVKVREHDYVILGDNCVVREYGITDDMILGVMNRVVRDGKDIYSTDRRYKLYSRLWVDFFPIRILTMNLKAKTWAAVRRVRDVFAPKESRR